MIRKAKEIIHVVRTLEAKSSRLKRSIRVVVGIIFHGQFCPSDRSVTDSARIMERTRLLLGVILLFILAEWAEGYAPLTEERTRGNPENEPTSESTAVATTLKSSRNPRWYRRGEHEVEDEEEEEEGMMDHDDQSENKAISHGKIDYWGGYYDFLINEGSYKFWAVFQLATAALLIYSGFAALYYAKVNPPTNDDYDDYFLRKRRRRRRRRDDAFLGLEPATFQRILDAINGQF